MPELNTYDDHFEIRHKRLSIKGFEGRFEGGLERITSLYSEEQADFSPISNRTNPTRQFMSGMFFDPVMALTMTKHPEGELTVVSYSLNRIKAKDSLDYLFRVIGLELTRPDQELVSDMHSMSSLSALTYEQSVMMSGSLLTSAENLWGHINYTQQLGSYHNMYLAQAIDKSGRQFGLSDHAKQGCQGLFN